MAILNKLNLTTTYNGSAWGDGPSAKAYFCSVVLEASQTSAFFSDSATMHLYNMSEWTGDHNLSSRYLRQFVFCADTLGGVLNTKTNILLNFEKDVRRTNSWKILTSCRCPSLPSQPRFQRLVYTITFANAWLHCKILGGYGHVIVLWLGPKQNSGENDETGNLKRRETRQIALVWWFWSTSEILEAVAVCVRIMGYPRHLSIYVIHTRFHVIKRMLVVIVLSNISARLLSCGPLTGYV